MKSRKHLRKCSPGTTEDGFMPSDLKGRGGKRGYKQKVRHLVEGLKDRHYSNVNPWLYQSGRPNRVVIRETKDACGGLRECEFFDTEIYEDESWECLKSLGSPNC